MKLLRMVNLAIRARSANKIKNDNFGLMTTCRRNISTGEPGTIKPDQLPKNPSGIDYLIRALVAGFVGYQVSKFIFFPNERWLESNYISVRELLDDYMSKGEVRGIEIKPKLEKAIIFLQPGAVIKGRKEYNLVRLVNIGDADKFEEKIRKYEDGLGIGPGKGVDIAITEPSFLNDIAYTAIMVGLTYALLSRIKIKPVLNQFVKVQFTETKNLSNKLSFKDIAGLTEAKQEIEEFVSFLNDPKKYRALGARIPRGALMIGPPGCGKTLLAKALANEANVAFLSVAGTEFVEVIGGIGAARVRNLFDDARRRSPSIVYIDEIDAIAAKRSANVTLSEGQSEYEQTLNQLLVEMDGLESHKKIIVVVASTNRPQVLDKAILRAGRFDRLIYIDVPNKNERIEIAHVYLRKLKLRSPAHSMAEHIAQSTGGMTGADIANICNEAAISAARKTKSFVDVDDIDWAIDRMRLGSAKLIGTMSPEERVAVATHEAGHALMSWMLKLVKPMQKVSIIQRLGRPDIGNDIIQHYDTDAHLIDSETIIQRMAVSLGGRMAENLKCKQYTTGARDDLKLVTKTAYQMVKKYGMSPVVGMLSFDETGTQSSFSKNPYSKKFQALIDIEARKMILTADAKAKEVIGGNLDKLDKLTERLLMNDTVKFQELVHLWGEPAFKLQ